MSPLSVPGGAPVKKGRGASVAARVKPALVVVGGFGALLVVIQLINSADVLPALGTPNSASCSRTWDGLVGIAHRAAAARIVAAICWSNLVAAADFRLSDHARQRTRQFVAGHRAGRGSSPGFGVCG